MSSIAHEAHSVGTSSKPSFDLTLHAVKTQVQTILKSDSFVASPQVAKFLEFVAEKTVIGAAKSIDAYAIATEALGRPSDFAADQDSIVRVIGSQLRKALELYYLTEGQDDPIVISLPKRGYVPEIEPKDGARNEKQPNTPRVLLTQAYLPRVAVFPCQAIFFDSWDERFCTGLTTQILTALAKFDGVSVLSPKNNRVARQATSDLSEFGELVDADFILKTEKVSGGDNGKILITLISARTLECLTSQAYDVNLSTDDMIDEQTKIAERLAPSMALPLGHVHRRAVWASARLELRELSPYQALLQSVVNRSDPSEAKLNRAIRAIEGVVEQDPDFGLACSILSGLYCEQYRLNSPPGDRNTFKLDAADELAWHAQMIEPDSAQANVALATALFFQERPEEALEYGERALRCNPLDYLAAAEFGLHLAHSGAWQEGLKLIEPVIGRKTQAFDRYRSVQVAWAYSRRDFEEALRMLRKISTHNCVINQLLKAMACGQLGLSAESVQSLDKLQQLRPGCSLLEAETILQRNYQSDMVELSLDGLRKAGLSA